MITGDNEETAKAIASESNIKEYYASCLPETKVETIKKLKEKYGTVAMVGDGINDAPALATASIGVAMGEGTDVALETADVVLMKNELSRLSQAIRLSKRMNRIVKQNVIFSLAVIAMLICSNFMQFLALPFGVIGHEGSTILVILNGLRLLKIKRVPHKGPVFLMVAIMPVCTTTRFMLWMRTTLLFIVIFIVVILLLLLMKYPPVPYYYGTRAHFSLRELLSPVL